MIEIGHIYFCLTQNHLFFARKDAKPQRKSHSQTILKLCASASLRAI